MTTALIASASSILLLAACSTSPREPNLTGQWSGVVRTQLVPCVGIGLDLQQKNDDISGTFSLNECGSPVAVQGTLSGSHAGNNVHLVFDPPSNLADSVVGTVNAVGDTIRGEVDASFLATTVLVRD